MMSLDGNDNIIFLAEEGLTTRGIWLEVAYNNPSEIPPNPCPDKMESHYFVKNGKDYEVS